MNYIMRHGRRIAIVTVNPDVASKARRKPRRRAQWVKLPRHWITSLRRSRSTSTLQLAHTILLATYERKDAGGELTLSSKVVTHMSRWSKVRAARELAELGLIRITQEGKGAPRVTIP